MSTNEVWIDQQSNVHRKSKLHSTFYWNFVECLTQKLLVRMQTEMPVISALILGL